MSPERPSGQSISRRRFLKRSGRAAVGAAGMAAGLGTEGCKNCEDESKEKVGRNEQESWQTKRERELGLNLEVEPVDPGEPLATFEGTGKGVGWNTNFYFKNQAGVAVEIAMSPERNYRGAVKEKERRLLSLQSEEPVILTIGASWCVPCREELTDLTLLAKSMEKSGSGGKVMFMMSESGSSYDDSKHKKIIKDFDGGSDLLNRVEFYPDDGQSWMSHVHELGSSKKEVVPVTMLLDEDGNIRQVVGGRAVNAEDIKKFRQHAAWLKDKE